MRLTDGKDYELVHDFNNGRAIINFDGAYALVDHIGNDVYELSGKPVREDEKPIFNALVKSLEAKGTIVTVTKDE